MEIILLCLFLSIFLNFFIGNNDLIEFTLNTLIYWFFFSVIAAMIAILTGAV